MRKSPSREALRRQGLGFEREWHVDCSFWAKRPRRRRVEVRFRKAIGPEEKPALEFLGPPFTRPMPGVEILKKGRVFLEGGRPLACDLLWERDLTVTLRDGVRLYLDVFRPLEVDGPVPAIVSWSPYGKGVPQPPPPGVPTEWVSGLQKFEGPDPAYWCQHGYAVVNVDTRGAFNSEGDIHFWGPIDAQDGYEVIEWVASQPWCNGRVALSGNSWLAIAQWFIAAQAPPHLAAIAPWEGLTDLYRHDVLRGGIPNTGFNELIIRSLRGHNLVEDIPAMVEQYPLFNEYWHQKAAPLEKVKVPAYVVASWTNDLHTLGTLEGFRRIASEHKWLRVHNTHEWHDYYHPENVEDLRRFFDFFLKGVKNGWEETPKVRLSILDPGGVDRTGVEESSWPVRAEYERFYLDAGTKGLSRRLPPSEAFLEYKADDGRGKAVFEMAFEEDVEVVGYIELCLYVESKGADDMDLFVLLEKCDAQGNPLRHKAGIFPYFGPHGRLRVSHRELEEGPSVEGLPLHAHRRELPLKEGEIVSCRIPLWPTGMKWRKGERLRLTICGYNPVPFHLPNVPGPKLRNKGIHRVHTGGKFPSYLYLPLRRI